MTGHTKGYTTLGVGLRVTFFVVLAVSDNRSYERLVHMI